MRGCLGGARPGPSSGHDKTPSRRDIVLSRIKRSGRGLEIGPSHNPITPKKEGFDVEIIDHLDQQGLREKYREHAVDIHNIEVVDYVWDGQKTYCELTGKKQYYDWIIASHVIEHTLDLIGFLKDCEKLLADNGILALIIPDKRYCFDYYRTVSSLARIIDQHLTPVTLHTPGTVAEYYLNVVLRNGHPCWSEQLAQTHGELTFAHDLSEARAAMHNRQVYQDVHNWCFVPHGFRLLVQDLRQLGFIGLYEQDFVDTIGCEFYVFLTKDKENRDIPRKELLESQMRELKVSITD